MKLVLDTNIVVSGTFWKGDSFRILDLVNKGKVNIIVTQPILEEYDKIIHSEEILEKIDIYQQVKIKVLQDILSKATLVDPKEKIQIIKDDPDDDKFLEAAIEAKADYIISKDKHLLKHREYKGIKIIKPEEFLKIIL